MKADPKAEAPAGGGKKKLIMIIAAVLALGLGGGGAYMFLMKKPAAEKHEEVAAHAEPPVFMNLEPFTVNLVPESGDQYLQVQFSLQVATQAQADLIKNNMPKVRSRLLLLLSNKKASELNTVDGKRELSSEIIEAVNRPFTEGGPKQQVSDVLYTSFIIQ
ncbi:flagellar basal body-associated protein FliL [Massilia sp. TS11]|uniref:flagellar basal body-associated protein FliL n=1 Tax=Massilia sp. TS11 TaxID=2908003 RepID=UPI001EDB8A7F|nr:flagellar basal body-associated protein FliL [Massilia sp. TS11]MCG2582875.1 flagellar basal body-associated protein FliL [Massilia sp. TS11]